MPAPAYDQEVSVYGTDNQPNRLRLKVYPLQRVAGAMLLTVDFTPVSDGGALGMDHFGSSLPGHSGQAFYDTSLVDTQSLVRYGPLRVDSSRYAATYSSKISEVAQKLGVTYRLGAFFPDPGAAVDRLTVDLQLGGMVPDVPISSDPSPAPGLVAGTAGVSAVPVRDDLVTWPVQQPLPGAFEDRHELVAKVVGGSVNEGTGRLGLVSVNADVLFAFDSATVTPAGTALVRQAAALLAAKADPGQPISVVGYTDAKGTPAYNAQLSNRRAAAVVAALRATGLVTGSALTPQGRGEQDPVAANTKSDGGDDPQGRALNRRVEINYAPKAQPQATPSTEAAPATTAATQSPTSASDGATAAASESTQGSVRLPRVGLPIGSFGANANFDTLVRPVTRDGNLSLVRFELTLEQGAADFVERLSSRSRAARDLGQVRVIDPATKRAYVPAFDRDDLDRLMCTYSHRMTAGAPFRFACLVAQLPSVVTSAVVSLGIFGTATDVPVLR